MLIADRGKLLAAIVGVVFSVVLVCLQGGLFLGLIQKASLLVDHCDADLWVGHLRMNNVDFPHDVPRQWVHRIRSVEGVESAEACLFGHSVMTLPSGGFEQVLVVGGNNASLQAAKKSLVLGDAEDVDLPDAVFMDIDDLEKVEFPQLGEVREIGRKRAKIVGFTRGILGFLVTPYIFTRYERAAEYLHKPSSVASYFLVRVKDDANLDDVRNAIEARLPNAETMTRGEYAWTSIQYWLTRTGIGISFGAATGLGLIVGLVVVGQTLYASVLDRVHEYATLKAMGATECQIQQIVLSQAVLLALAGSAVGVIGVAIIQSLFSSPRAPISIPYYVSLTCCLLISFICLLAALAPYLAIRRVDPAIVLQ